MQVNAISPVANTRMAGQMYEFYAKQFGEEAVQAMSAEIPDPAVMAPSFVYLASADSSFVTGHVLMADGGLTS